MSKELEARIDRLEVIVGSLLDELIVCKEHLARSTEMEDKAHLAGQLAAQRNAQLAQTQNARAMAQLQSSAAQSNLIGSTSNTLSGPPAHSFQGGPQPGLSGFSQFSGEKIKGKWFDEAAVLNSGLFSSLLGKSKV